VEKNLGALFEGWSGPAADGYRARWEEVRRGLAELDYRLHIMADRLRILAGQIEDAQSHYDQLLGAMGVAAVAGIGLTVFTLGASDIVAGEAEGAAAASAAAVAAEFELVTARMAALMGEVAEFLGTVASRFAVDFPVVALRLADGPAGGAAIGVGVALATGSRDPADLLASGLLGAAENVGPRSARGSEDELGPPGPLRTAPQPRGLKRHGDLHAEMPRWDGPTGFDAHAIKSMKKRGWTKSEVEELITHHAGAVRVRDTHWLANGTRVDEPATAYTVDFCRVA